MRTDAEREHSRLHSARAGPVADRKPGAPKKDRRGQIPVRRIREIWPSPARRQHRRHHRCRLPGCAKMRLLYPREKERRNSFRKVSVLTGDRMSDSFLQRFHTMPFILRPDPTIAADLIDAPVNFHRVVVRIAKLYGDLATGPAAALKIDLNLIRTQAITSADNCGECRNFKGEVMQLFVRRLALAGAD